jgi:hypothetical protein
VQLPHQWADHQILAVSLLGATVGFSLGIDDGRVDTLGASVGYPVGIDDGRMDTLGAWVSKAQYSRMPSMAFSSVMP